MNNQVNAKAGLSVKDLVTTGIFTALLFVFIMVGGVFFATNPMLTFFMPAGSALLAGPVYLLMIAKVHKRWSITIMGVIMAIIWFVTGMHWAFALGYLIMAVVADFVAGTKQYKSKKINSLSYILFSLGGTGRTLFSSLIPRLGTDHVGKWNRAKLYRHHAGDRKRGNLYCHVCRSPCNSFYQCICGLQNAEEAV